MLDAVAAAQAQERGDRAVHDGDDQRAQPGRHGEVEQQDEAGGERPGGEQAGDARAAEDARSLAGLTTLLGELGTGEGELLADEGRRLGGQPAEELALRLLAQVGVGSVLGRRSISGRGTGTAGRSKRGSSCWS